MFRKVEVIIIVGTPGSGKKTAAYNITKGAYIKDDSNQWYGGYEGHDTMIMVNFNPWHVSFIHFLQIVDGCKMNLQVMGGVVASNWTRVIITTEFPVEGWPYSVIRYFKNVSTYNFNEASERIRFSVQHRVRNEKINW